jgi:hypothetical protein
MINTIILSENNPARLRILLQSARKNSMGEFNFNILHRSLNSDYEPLYDKLKVEFSDLNINWTGYSNFKEAILRFLQTNAQMSMFLRDEDIFYGHENYSEIKTLMEKEQDVLCFSLRLGRNTKFCRNMNTSNTLFGETELLDGKVIKWDWSKSMLDYGFPCSSEGHIFRTRDLLKMIKQVSFDNFDKLEENMYEIFETYPKQMMCSFANSVLVKDIAGPDLKQINQMYTEEKPIEFSEMDFSNIDGCWAHIPKPTREVKQVEKIETNGELNG